MGNPWRRPSPRQNILYTSAHESRPYAVGRTSDRASVIMYAQRAAMRAHEVARYEGHSSDIKAYGPDYHGRGD